jgi:hypothetical protein
MVSLMQEYSHEELLHLIINEPKEELIKLKEKYEYILAHIREEHFGREDNRFSRDFEKYRKGFIALKNATSNNPTIYIDNIKNNLGTALTGVPKSQDKQNQTRKRRR